MNASRCWIFAIRPPVLRSVLPAARASTSDGGISLASAGGLSRSGGMSSFADLSGGVGAQCTPPAASPAMASIRSSAPQTVALRSEAT
jgi:hypothetical protein